MIKRLTVSLVLSEDISDADAQKVRNVVQDLLGMDAKRGDEIMVLRARFAPIWYTPEMMNILVKYGILAVIAIVCMGIVAIGFLKMAGAMNNMAGSGQPQKISMEMGGGMGVPGDDAALGLPEPEQKRLESSREGPPEIASFGDGVVFNVLPEKLGILVSMLAKDEPADIALVAAHLPAGLRSQFISRFPMEKGAAIVANIAKVRFVDPEMITKIKEELERRLSGAVGGYEKALEIIGNIDIKAKKALFDNLQKNYPEVAARVRPGIIFFEDIEKLSEKDLAILVGTVSVEQWALAVWQLSESVKPRLKAQMAKHSWQMVEQSMKYGRPPEDKIDKAVENVIASVWRLIAGSRIINPNAAGVSPLNGDQAEIAFKSPPFSAPAAAVPGVGPTAKKAGEEIINVPHGTGFEGP
jgi:hypothetical protein